MENPQRRRHQYGQHYAIDERAAYGASNAQAHGAFDDFGYGLSSALSDETIKLGAMEVPV